MVKKILIVVFGLIILLLLIGFVLPGKFEITKSAVVNAPPENVFEEVNDLEKWFNWSYWHSLDPDMKVTYGDRKFGEGASYSWTGNSKVGEGKLVITKSIPSKSISADLFFMQSDEPSIASYKFEPDGENTTVTMSFSTDFGMNPLMRWMGALMFPSEMNKAFDYNLSHLKEVAEAKPRFTVTITEETVTPVSYIGIQTTMSFENSEAISAQMGKSYGELMTVLQKAKVESTGAPFCLYPRWDEEKKEMDMVCALSVPDGAKLPAKYPVMQTTAGKAVKAIHLGDYKNLEDTHNQIAQYMELKKLEMNGAPWEVYITDPGTEPDITKWVTEVYYPVK